MRLSHGALGKIEATQDLPKTASPLNSTREPSGKTRNATETNTGGGGGGAGCVGVVEVGLDATERRRSAEEV
jgi:hypothetical protein